MKFDIIIGNPPFNIAQEKNIAGTGGNTTLYKTLTKKFLKYLNINGSLLFISLKGIIKDLNSEQIRNNYNVKFIDLMDEYNFWDFNTCIFLVENSGSTEIEIKITGGWCKNIFSINEHKHFNYTYYSSSNNGMDKLFSPNSKNRVIRRLPGRNNNNCIYDFTNKEIKKGPKLAFSVLESRKSYTVTDEPIYGGTICYIETETLQEAENLKKFLLNNKIFKEYIKKMKFREYAFQLKSVKSFDLNQISSGFEIPNEWNILEEDIVYNEISKCNFSKSLRSKELGEFFTPEPLCDIVLAYIPKENWNELSTTFLDPTCGNGNFLVAIKNRLKEYGFDEKQILERLYGVDIIENNVRETKNRLDPEQKYKLILDKNIVCADALIYDYNFDKLFS